MHNTVLMGTESIRGVEFAVEKGSTDLVGHCWAADKVSGIVCALVESGRDWAELKQNWNELLDSTIDYLRDENGEIEPVLYGLGWDYSNPPPPRITVA